MLVSNFFSDITNGINPMLHFSIKKTQCRLVKFNGIELNIVWVMWKVPIIALITPITTFFLLDKRSLQ